MDLNKIRDSDDIISPLPDIWDIFIHKDSVGGVFHMHRWLQIPLRYHQVLPFMIFYRNVKHFNTSYCHEDHDESRQ